MTYCIPISPAVSMFLLVLSVLCDLLAPELNEVVGIGVELQAVTAVLPTHKSIWHSEHTAIIRDKSFQGIPSPPKNFTAHCRASSEQST